ncbi:hypothetical protein BY457_12111 [Marinilabilia salmonicolor]|jgi:hypothetical protein|uniref:hypothetical protein n=1 Tax=Marinilabilia salmonicolor TaxID=989 RepID=UPI000D04F1A6|nr:hypothetical protein [Marinilabilia salmonicolor]PRY93819.1 hypothetical protein BY457_12111 [Marinilabilia salmonicolor]
MKKLTFLIVLALIGVTIWGQDTNKIKSTGDVGIGTTKPQATLHIKSAGIAESSLINKDANLIIEGTGTSRTIGQGAALGFVVPATTDGSSSWQQGRILVTPDNSANYNAAGRMYLQTRYNISGGWDWRNNLVLTSNGNVGIGITNPNGQLEVRGSIYYSLNDQVKTIVHTSGDGNSYFNFIGGATNSRIGFQIDGSSKMSILNSGDVGIGKIPTTKLDVAGNIKCDTRLSE